MTLDDSLSVGSFTYTVFTFVGSFHLFEELGPNGLFVLPQKSYLTSGSLADQVGPVRRLLNSIGPHCGDNGGLLS